MTADPFEYVEKALQSVSRLYSQPAQRSGRAATRLVGIGKILAEQLLPDTLCHRLFALAGPEEPDLDRSVPTLYLLSDESWLPWELMYLVDGKRPGRFLAEAFAVTRWPLSPAPAPVLPLHSIALVVPADSGLMDAEAEAGVIEKLSRVDRRQVVRLTARYHPVLTAFGSGNFDGLHFTGHGIAEKNAAELSGIVLEDGTLTPVDLAGAAFGPETTRPLVFLNACQSGRSGEALTRLSGLSEAFLQAGAGAFFGTHWSVEGDGPRHFAEFFYQGFITAGLPLGEAVRQARLRLHAHGPSDPTWLAYTVFGHPLAVCAAPARPNLRVYHPGVPTARASRLFTLPQRRWQEGDSPGALLRADFGVVPFHRRDQELAELEAWCEKETPLALRLYTGPGGTGKTRLALELCRLLRDRGWRAGFIPKGLAQPPDEVAEAVLSQPGRLLVVVDYAEERQDLLRPLLSRVQRRRGDPVRILLLARAALEWWKRLQQEGDGIGPWLSGSSSERVALGQLAFDVEDRGYSYQKAGDAFASMLQRNPPGQLPEDLSAGYYDRALLLHMSALIAIDGVQAREEGGVLDAILERERKFWRERVKLHGLPAVLGRAVGRAMALITFGGGVANENEAVETCRTLSIFDGQPESNLVEIAHLLHGCYPGETQWIDPIQPDLLGEHLVQRELEAEQDKDDPEIFRLTFGPRIA